MGDAPTAAVEVRDAVKRYGDFTANKEYIRQTTATLRTGIEGWVFSRSRASDKAPSVSSFWLNTGGQRSPSVSI